MNRTSGHFVSALLWMALSIGCTVAVQAADVPTNLPSTRVAAADPQLIAFKQAIRSKYDLKERAFAAHDVETIVTRFYAADAITAGEGSNVAVGRDQIRADYQKEEFKYRIKFDSVYTFVDGDAGWDWADFGFFSTDGTKKLATVGMVVLWAKVNGQWMCKGEFYVTGSLRAGKLGPLPTAAK